MSRRMSLLLPAVGLAAFFVLASVQASHAPPSVEGLRAPLGHDLAAIAATRSLPAATWYNDHDGDKVFDSLEERFAMAPMVPLSVIVTFRDGADFSGSLAEALAAAGSVEPIFVFPNLGGFSALLDARQAAAVARLDAVRQIEWDTPGTPELDTATETFGARAVQEQLGIDAARDLARGLDQDVTIAILDTGFHEQHVDLKGAFVGFWDAADQSKKNPYDAGDHGTHVASIAAGRGVAEPKYKGVAPGASILGFKITGALPYGGADGSKAGALWAYDKILDLQDTHNVRVATISFGFGPTGDGTDALELAVDRVFEAGVLPFKSTGNSGPERGTVTIPGGARGIIGVANMHDAGPTEDPSHTYVAPEVSVQYDYGFHLRTSSSRGPTADGRIKPDLSAPGSSIMAADAETGGGYVAKSGTSMAAPFAAGTAALMFAADPNLTAERARQILFETAQDWGPPGPDIDYGNGRLDTLRAVQAVLIERLKRELAPYAEIAAVLDVEAPNVPVHVGGSITDLGAVATFQITDATLPVAVTVIHNQSTPAPAGPAFARRLFSFEVVDPDGVLIGKVTASSPFARQLHLAFQPQVTGTYTIQFLNVAAEGNVIWDVSGGMEDLQWIPLALPNATEYELYRQQELDLEPASGIPGLGPWAIAAALAAGCLIVRRFRQEGL